MAVLPGFLGPSNRSHAYTFDNERTVNLYPEIKDKGTPKSGMTLIKVPGMQPFVSLPAGPVRAIYHQDGECWAIGGTAFCEIFPNRNYIVRGTVAADSYPATISSNGQNGHQLFVTSGGYGYIYDLITKEIEQITDDGFPYPVAMGDFVNSSFLALQRSSNKVFYSDLLDGTSWSGLNFFQTSLTADDKPAMVVNHGDIWLFGTQRSEIWVGDGSNGFAPIPGTIVESGIIAPWSVQRLDNTVYYLSGDERGNNQVVRIAGGYTPEIVSTYAISTYLNALGPNATNDAMAWTYSEENHAFYVLYVPSAETTLVYDVSTDLWHERALWDDDLMRFIPDFGRCHAFAFGKHLVGDRGSGTVFHQSLEYQQDLVVDA